MIKEVVLANGEYYFTTQKAAERYQELSSKALKTLELEDIVGYDYELKECIREKKTRYIVPDDREDPYWVQVIKEGLDKEYFIEEYDDEYQSYDIGMEYIGHDIETFEVIPVVNVKTLMSLHTPEEVIKYLNKLNIKYKQ